MLPKFVEDLELKLTDMEAIPVDKNILESSDVTGGAELFLYQSGYLTIKDFNSFDYILGIPNNEVRQALYAVVIPALTLRSKNDVVTAQNRLRSHLNFGNVDEAMNILKAMVADVPYSNKKLANMGMEERYRFIISCIFHAIGLRVEVEHMMTCGRIDIVTWAMNAIYVIELKLTNNGGLEAARQQILANQYAAPFSDDSREVIPLAIELDDNGKGILRFERI